MVSSKAVKTDAPMAAMKAVTKDASTAVENLRVLIRTNYFMGK